MDVLPINLHLPKLQAAPLSAAKIQNLRKKRIESKHINRLFNQEFGLRKHSPIKKDRSLKGGFFVFRPSMPEGIFFNLTTLLQKKSHKYTKKVLAIIVFLFYI